MASDSWPVALCTLVRVTCQRAACRLPQKKTPGELVSPGARFAVLGEESRLNTTSGLAGLRKVEAASRSKAEVVPSVVHHKYIVGSSIFSILFINSCLVVSNSSFKSVFVTNSVLSNLSLIAAKQFSKS